MFISDLVGKKIYSGGKIHGVCRGVGLSVKSRSVKYLICAELEKENELIFSLCSIAEISPSGIRLKRFRPLAPQTIASFFCSRPIYDDRGNYLGIVSDLEIENGRAVTLVADTGATYSAYSIIGVSDAVLLKSRLIFPLGEKIPTFLQTETKSPVVSKAVLKQAVEEGRLIRLTLSLPLFTKNYG